MKKVLVSLAMACATTAQAQVFLGGTGRIGYTNDVFVLGMVPEVGYEINEKWAVGVGLGMNMAAAEGDSEVLGVAEPFVRFTPWQNKHVAFDIKAMAEMEFQNCLYGAEIGLRPSVRFFLNKHLDATVDFGIVGASYNGYDWSPAMLFTGMNTQFGIAYKF